MCLRAETPFSDDLLAQRHDELGFFNDGVGTLGIVFVDVERVDVDVGG